MTVEFYVQAQQKKRSTKSTAPKPLKLFFIFLVQHYGERLREFFRRAGAMMEEYNAVLAYFDRKGSTHFTKPNQRDLRAILSTTQTAEERERDLRRMSQLPEMQPQHKT
eukprot:3593896-Amphidinium_carterae.1